MRGTKGGAGERRTPAVKKSGASSMVPVPLPVREGRLIVDRSG
jgi:hypothetical protein